MLHGTSLNKWHRCDRWSMFERCPYTDFEDEQSDEPVDRDTEPPFPEDPPAAEPGIGLEKPDDLIEEPPWWPWIWEQMKEDPVESPVPEKVPEQPTVPIPFPIPGKPEPEENPIPDFPVPEAAFELITLENLLGEPTFGTEEETSSNATKVQPHTERPPFLGVGPGRIVLPPLPLGERTPYGERARMGSMQLNPSFGALSLSETLTAWLLRQYVEAWTTINAMGDTPMPTTSRSSPKRSGDALSWMTLAGAAVVFGDAAFRGGGGGGFFSNWTELMNGLAGRERLIAPTILESDFPDQQAVEDALI